MIHQTLPVLVGRGTHLRTPNRFEQTRCDADLDHLSDDDAYWLPQRAETEFFSDDSKSFIAKNDSPDVGFTYSINPYRGCEHGCAYCYARPSHELLGMNAGRDFETKILVKHRAPEILRRELCHPRWKGEMIALSGNTDCYQPAEREYRITRRCLEVMVEARQAVSIITKNRLVTRDLDLLRPLAEKNLVHVSVSITSLDQTLTRSLEPRTSSPAARLRAIAELADAGIPVGVMLAPVIPGLNDDQIPAILDAAHQAGARTANYIMLRLPFAVSPIFREYLQRVLPNDRDRIEARIQAIRGGRLNDPRFGSRHRGTGKYADGIAKIFRVFAGRHGLDKKLPPLDITQFRPPSRQRTLFD